MKNERGEKQVFLFPQQFVSFLFSALARAPRLKLLLFAFLSTRERRRFFPLCSRMSSTKLTGLSANAGSGSDNDDEAKTTPSARSIVVAIEKTDDGLSAVKFAAENVLKGEVREQRGARERVEDSLGVVPKAKERQRGKGSMRKTSFYFDLVDLVAVFSHPNSSRPPPPPPLPLAPPLSQSHHENKNKTTNKQQNDTLHIVHVAKIMSAREEVSHGIPGTSLSYRDESLGEVKAHVEEARAWLRDVIVPAAAEGAARAGGAAVRVHLFVDKTTASSDDLAATLAKAADDLGAAVLVLSKSNKTRLDRLFVGSVAGKTQKICGRPVLLVTSGGGAGDGA